MKKLIKKIQLSGAVFKQGARQSLDRADTKAVVAVSAALGFVNDGDNRLQGAVWHGGSALLVCMTIDGVEHVINNRKLIREAALLEED